MIDTMPMQELCPHSSNQVELSGSLDHGDGLPYMGDVCVHPIKDQYTELNANSTQKPSTAIIQAVTDKSQERRNEELGQPEQISKPFCWCCCFSCSCMRMKRRDGSPDDSKPSKTDNSSSSKLTMDEVLSWKQSFERLISSGSGRKVFREFLKTEYSEENLLFWMACEDLRTLDSSDEEAIEDRARTIYEDYISILSPKEVSLDARVREIINENMVKPSTKTFDEAQMQIYTLMHRDSYPRFLASPVYQKYLDAVGAG